MKYLILLTLIFTYNHQSGLFDQAVEKNYESLFNSAENTVLVSRNGMYSIINFIKNSNSDDLSYKSEKS